MLFYSEAQIRRELAGIAMEDDALGMYQSYVNDMSHSSSDKDKGRIRDNLIDLYGKERDLIERLSAVLRAIDEQWLADPSDALTDLFNEVVDRIDKINDRAYKTRKLINDFV